MRRFIAAQHEAPRLVPSSTSMRSTPARIETLPPRSSIARIAGSTCSFESPTAGTASARRRGALLEALLQHEERLARARLVRAAVQAWGSRGSPSTRGSCPPIGPVPASHSSKLMCSSRPRWCTGMNWSASMARTISVFLPPGEVLVAQERRRQVQPQRQVRGPQLRAPPVLVVHGHAQPILPVREVQRAQPLEEGAVGGCALHEQVLAVVDFVSRLIIVERVGRAPPPRDAVRVPPRRGPGRPAPGPRPAPPAPRR